MHGIYIALVLLAAIVHAGFMVGEMHPWPKPRLLSHFADKPPGMKEFDADQLWLIAAIVKNAGIYNAIIAGGLFWAIASDNPGIARVLLLGAGVAGLFGAVTLKSRAPMLQAAVGLAGFFVSLAI